MPIFYYIIFVIIGEIYAKGPNVMLGYFQNEEATKDVFDKDWFKTGDLGYIDKKGFLYLCGRKKSVIVLKNGKKVTSIRFYDVYVLN